MGDHKLSTGWAAGVLRRALYEMYGQAQRFDHVVCRTSTELGLDVELLFASRPSFSRHAIDICISFDIPCALPDRA